MCGIVGALSANLVESQLVSVMRDRLQHRGPDHAGLWQSPDRRVCLGHRRLAVLDLSPDANQPFVSSDGRLVITFNGEIYNFQDVRNDLSSRGVKFRTRSDTEILLEAFRCWGEQCLERLAGMFAFAIWDASTRRLFCARDRAGEKPFYYAAVGRSFVFGSEIKALTVWPGFMRGIHYPALIDYLTLGFVPDPKSIWEGCLKLPPGHFMWVEMPKEGGPVAGSPRAYWDFEMDPDESVTDWGTPIREQLRAAAKQMAFADVPVGTFLSGGVDSSSVTAALSKEGRSVNTFTVGFQESAYDERPWAAELSRLYGTDHTERTVTPDDVTAVFEKLLWHYDEPFNDYSYVPTFYVCREARKRITVALSGDGADELFAGYSKYKRLSLREQFGRIAPAALASPLIAGASLFLPKTHRLRKKLAAYGKDLHGALADTLTTAFSLDEIRAAARGPLAETLRHFSPMDTISPLISKAPPRKVGILNSMRYLDLKLTLAGDMLVKVDRASMAVSLEVRPVYLHRDMMNLASRIPPALLADRNQSKKLLKASLRPWLPDSILYRRKMGFAMPLQKWVGGDLQSLFSDGGRQSALEDWLDVGRLGALARVRTQENGGSALLAHNLFFLEHWREQWISGSGGAEVSSRQNGVTSLAHP
jgi:asparagine synthase (glutamine-hydrolysing)